MPKAATSRAPADARTRKMRAVLAACRRLGLDEDARKDLQLELTGVGSMADMSEGELGQLLDHLNRDYRGTNPDRAHIAKAKALWWSLYWLGAIDEPGDKALSAFVKRQTGIAALRFLDHRHAHSVIEALKSWLTREGVVWFSDANISGWVSDWPAYAGYGRAEWDRWAVINELGRRLRKANVIHSEAHYASASLKIAPTIAAWRARDSLFTRWATLSEHRWSTSRERRSELSLLRT